MEDKIKEIIESDTGFIKNNEFKIIELNNKKCILEYKVKKNGLNPYSIVHGGILFGLADTCAGLLSTMNGFTPVTLDSNISYLRNVSEGKIYAEAFILKEGKTIGFYKVEIKDENNNILSVVNINMYNKKIS